MAEACARLNYSSEIRLFKGWLRGWQPVPAYHIPTTVTGHVRLGKEDDIAGSNTPLTQEPATDKGEIELINSALTPLTTEDSQPVETQLNTQPDPKTDVLALGS